MKTCTLIFPYYENPGMLLEQLRYIAENWPDKVRRHWHLVVVDDGSPDCPAVEALKHWTAELPLVMSLYRITVDVPWNWIAARNLAVHKSANDFFLMTDIDHIVPAPTARSLVEAYHNPKTGYRFGRVSAPDMTPYHPHPNSWFMTKAMFNQVGGYDERFSGGYGTDKEFMNRVNKTGKGIKFLDDVLIRVGREVVADASTTRYERKTQKDADRKARVRAMIAADPVPKRLTFPWEMIFEGATKCPA